MDKDSKVAAESNESVGALDNLGSSNRSFFRKSNLNFWKQLNLANLMSTATETVSQFDVQCEKNSEISQNFQKLEFLQEEMGFPKNTLNFLKMARGIKFVVESNWKSKISQNSQNSILLKKQGVLERISWTFDKWIKVAKLPQIRMNQ